MLTILTQNLYGAEEHEPDRRAHAFADILERTAPDVVALQEVRPFNLRPLLARDKLLGLYPQLAASYVRNAIGNPPWTLMLVRAQPHVHVLSHSRHGVGDWRGMDVLHVNVSGRPITFASAHFRAFDCPSAARLEAERHRRERAALAAASTPRSGHASSGHASSGQTSSTHGSSGHASSASSGAAEAAAFGAVKPSAEPCPGGATRLADLQSAFDILSQPEHGECVLMGDFNFDAHAELFPAEHRELQRHPEWRDAWIEANATHPGWTWDNRRNPLNKRDEAVPADGGGDGTAATGGGRSQLRQPPGQLVEDDDDDDDDEEEEEEEGHEDESGAEGDGNGGVGRRHPRQRRPPLNFPSGRIDRILVRGEGLRVTSATLANDHPVGLQEMPACLPSDTTRACTAVAAPLPTAPLRQGHASSAVASTSDRQGRREPPSASPPLFLSDHFGISISVEVQRGRAGSPFARGPGAGRGGVGSSSTSSSQHVVE